jgi:alkylhydroperoxidase family enzyme
MARIPYIDLDKAPASTREVFEILPAKLNIFRMMAHAETSFRPLLRLGTSILGQQQLSGKLRELAILQVAQQSPAKYEWIQHVPIGKAVGVSDEQVAALERGAIDADCFDDEERAVLVCASELVGDVRPSDATFAALQKHFSEREIVELILAVGYYMMLARLMETTGIDLEEAAGGKVFEQAQRNARELEKQREQ